MNLKVPSALALAVLLCAAPAAAQKKARLMITDSANYETSLKCYQYYAIAEQIAEAMKDQEGATPEQVAQETARIDLAQVYKASWNMRVNKTKGEKTDDQVNADLERVSKPIIETANAALSGDATAAQNHDAVQAGCKVHEKVEQLEG